MKKIKITYFLFLIILLFKLISPACATLKKSHPRLMSQEWINQLTEWSQDENWEPWQRFKSFADSSFGDSYDPGRLFAKALMCKMGKGQNYCDEALNNFDSIVNSVGTSVDKIGNRANYIAYAYDLLYDQLPSTSQKNAVDKFIQWQDIIKNYGPCKNMNVARTWCLRRFSPVFTAAAAGAYDPSNTPNDLEEEYNYWKDNFLKPLFYWMEKVFHGAINNGVGYGTMLGAPYLIRAAEVIYMAEGVDVFNQYKWFSKNLIWEWQIFSIAPFEDPINSGEYGWYYHTWGQSVRMRVKAPFYARLNILLLLTRISSNPYKGQIFNYLYESPYHELNKTLYTKSEYGALWSFLYGAKDLKDLSQPPSLQFWYTNKHKNLSIDDPNYEYGPGYVFMRTGYNVDDIYISFKCGDMLGRIHDNLEEGTFQLWAKGEDLAIHSGTYDGSGEYDQTSDYFSRTVSMNGLIIYDPNEKFYFMHNIKGYRDNDGGQRSYTGFPLEYSSSIGEKESAFKDWLNTSYYPPGSNSNPPGVNVKGKLLKADHIDNKYSYVFCDVTRAYNSDEYVEGANAGNSAKVSKVTREISLIGNKYFIVFDRVVKKHPTDYSVTPKEGEPYPYQDKWLLHSLSMFTVNGTETIVSDGEQLYTNTDGSFYTFVKNFSQDGAYLYGKVVYPANDFQIRKFNGNKKFWNYQRNVEMSNNQGNWTAIPFGEDRIEIEPLDTSLYHKYLVVLYPAKPDEPSMPQVVKVESSDGSMVGAHIKDNSKNYVVMYSADSGGAEVTGSITYSIIPTANITQHFIFGVKAKTAYKITYDKIHNTISIKPDDNGNYISSSDGVLVFETSKSGISSSIPSPPSNLKIIR